MEMGKLIAEARRERGLTQEDLAEASACTLSAVQKWEAGTTIPRPKRLLAIASALGKPVAYFLEDSPSDVQTSAAPELAAEIAALRRKLDALDARPPVNPALPPPEGLVLLPVYGRATAGAGGFADDQPTGYEHYPITFIPEGQEDACFLLEVTGDSMIYGRIMPGDKVLICKTVAVRDGDIAAVEVDGEYLVKRVYFKNGKVVLRSDNPHFPDIEADRATIIGRAMKGGYDL